ncbi:MAG: bifunctional demethylmenaquinone methyltransferase/2-methoxy-6-polyprenyl-1,4-benzoquinol methylase UbiE [Candidatus Delongbacteria bacterium]|jgi:demethylmenaquinone methyltransferase/2-methoxy-6-polyprenyl-1,4-benzoquinol methylase|nr:bifunctional demethylmenaquinone methyltransferase/2-methoxy-6-polyprenyl-1,4-benzoquinol methylase UbiE [Candidatus Delongbacteria bacterium]
MREKPPTHPGDSVDDIFSRIAGRYDFLNHFLSCGIDKLWRRKLRRIITQHHPNALLDIATGTGDMLILLHDTGVKHLHGIDPAPAMLEKAQAKLKKRNISDDIQLHTGYAEDLPFDPGSFDLANIVFGIRNFDNIETSLSEIKRILKPGGSITIMEFDMPRNRVIKPLYVFYLKHIIPSFGALISGNKAAYKYLAESILAFSRNSDVNAKLKQTGFYDIKSVPLFFGIARIYSAIKH